METKFKVGDCVRVTTTGEGGSHDFKVGELVLINYIIQCKADNGDPYFYNCMGALGISWGLNNSEVELACEK